ncbi:MAG: universal stress protein, partial [Chitinophagaceae bacterium]|nr:universal stress protein [Chitinophagaceae bacterium]
MKKIIVPTDFSPNADKALDYAVQIAIQSGGEIILVHAVDPEIMEDKIRKATEKMELTIKGSAGADVINIIPKVCLDRPIPGILGSISEYNADLVVMGTLGNTALAERILGSITASVIGKSPVPVLAIPLLSDWKVPKKILLAINHFDEKESQLLPVIDLARLFSASIQVTIFTDTDDGFVEDYDEDELKIAAYRDMLKEQYKDLEIHAVHLAGKHFKENVKNWIDNNE